jgi:hypothetical protein
MDHRQPRDLSLADRQRLARLASEAAAQLGWTIELARDLGEPPVGMTLDELHQAGVLPGPHPRWNRGAVKDVIAGSSAQLARDRGPL